MLSFGAAQVETAGSVTQTSSDIGQVLHQARLELDYLSSDEDFQAECAERHIGADDRDKPHYWSIVDGYMRHKCEILRSEGAAGRDLVFRELLAALPHYLQTQYFLDNRHHYIDDQAFELAKATASRFNGLIRDAAQAWPGVKASVLIGSLLDLAAESIRNKDIRQAADYYIRATVRGAQHELVFGQLLDRAGYTYRHGSTYQDLHGIDYVILKRGRPDIYIDVKASLAEIRRNEHDRRLFERAYDGHLIMYSLLSDEELDDSFRVSDEVATHKAHQLVTLLHDARPHRLRH